MNGAELSGLAEKGNTDMNGIAWDYLDVPARDNLLALWADMLPECEG